MAWEFDVLNALQAIHSPVLDKIMWFVSTIGNAGIFWMVLSVIFVIPKKYRRMGLQMMAAMMLTFIIGNLVLKNAVHRIRPCWIDDTKALKDGLLMLGFNPLDYSFPSGHSMNGFTAATTMMLCNKRLGYPAVILATLIAFSRLYAYVHFPTDVLAGIAIGYICALFVNFIFRKMGWKKRA